MKDTKAAYENWMSDPKVTTYLTWPAHKNIKITEQLLTMWIQKYEEPDFYQWAIQLKENEELIGNISVVNINEKTDTVEIGYCMGQKWQHNGYMKESLENVIDFMTEKVKALRVEARHDAENTASGKVMKSCNMVYEGTLRQAGFNNRGIVDECVYSILSKERIS